MFTNYIEIIFENINHCFGDENIKGVFINL